MREKISEALKAAGEIYLRDIVLSPVGPAFEAEVADFAINFAIAARATEGISRKAAITQLPLFFKGEKMFSLIEGEVPAGGMLEFENYTMYGDVFQIDVLKEGNLYSIRYSTK